MITLDVRDPGAFAASRSVMYTALAEAARVMLWKFHDVPPPNTHGTWTLESNIEWIGRIPVFNEAREEQVEIAWEAPTEADQAAHANELDATEFAAYAVALAVADQLGFRILARMQHGSGADWVMVPRGEPANDYYKLEVSGMARIGAERPEARLRAKREQGSGGDYNRPGLAVVVRFEDATVLSETWR